MTLSDDYFNYVEDQLALWSPISSKRMFGVLGLYREGLMFGIIAENKVYLKIDDSNKHKYIKAGSTPLRVFKRKSEVPSYYELPEEVLEDSEKFMIWANESFEIQSKKNR